MSFTHIFYVGNDTPVEVTFSATPFVAARTSGPVERCHDAEGGEVEIEEITIGGFDVMDLLSEAIIAKIQSLCEEKAPELIEDERNSALEDLAASRYDDN